MKKTYVLLLLNALFFNIQAQNFDWAKREGLWAYDYGYGITTDNSGNVYVAGKYELNADFSGTILPDQGNHDIYVAKYTPTGAITWVRTAGGSLGDYAHAIACDGSNYVYVAGEIEGTNTPVTFVGSSTTLNCVSDNDIFLAKYDLNGNLAWAKQAGWWHSEKALGVTYDNSGNVYICGYYNDTTIFETTTVTGYGDNDIFVAKYDMNGNFIWVQKAGSAGRDEAKAIKCDAAGNIYICGMYSNGAVFGTQTLIAQNGYYEAFVAKYSTNGTLLWVKNTAGAYDEVAWGLTIDNAGKIYITGEFNASANFGAIQLITSGNADVFVTCYDASGNVQWAKGAGGALIDRARGIGCDGTNLYITGQFATTASFGSYTLVGADSSEIFMAKLDNTGNYVWATSVGGVADAFEPLGYECGNTICAEASGNVYATGSLISGGDFGTTSLSAYSRTDIFITKISQGTISTQDIDAKEGVSIYPNPGNGNFTVNLSYLANQKNEITIFNCLGQVIKKITNPISSKITIDLSDETKGIYFIEIKTDQTILTKKVIIK